MRILGKDWRCWLGLHEWEWRDGLIGFLDTYRGQVCRRPGCERLRIPWMVRSYE